MSARKTDAAGRYYWKARAYQGDREYTRCRWSHQQDVRSWLITLGQPGETPAPVEVETVRDLLELWMGVVAASARKPRTIRGYRVAARRVVAGIGPYPARQLLQGLLEDYVETQLGAGRASTSTRMDVMVTRASWAWARRRALVESNDLPTVKIREGLGARNHRTPTAGEVAAVVAALEARPALWCAPAVRLLWALGCRPGELGSLRWDRVDLVRGLVTLDGKTGPRLLPLGREAWAELQSLHERTGPEGYVLGVQPGTMGQLHDRMQKACAAAGITYWNPYGARHAATDRMARAGVDVGSAAALLGNSPAVMLKHYRRVTREDMERAVERADLGALPRGDVVAFRAARNKGPEQSGEDDS